MKFREQILALLLLLLLPALGRAGFIFNTNADNTITVTGYSEYVTSLNIPDTINGLPVTGVENLYFSAPASVESIIIPTGVTNIAPNAFLAVGALISVYADNPAYGSENGVLFNKDRTVLIRYPGKLRGSYIIPNTVTNVGDLAFYYCQNLTNIIIPNGVIRLGNSAFYACDALSKIIIPASVSSIGTNALFAPGLTNITVDASNRIFSSLAGVLFNKDQTVLIQYPMRVTGNYTVPGTVTQLGDGAFRYSALTSITILTNVTTLGTGVFASCYGLTSITIPDSVTNIGDSDFFFCQNLTNAALPGSIVSIGNSAFGGCNNLVGFFMPQNLVSIGDSAFYFCENLTNITIPNGVTNIGAYAFSECFCLTNIIIPCGINEIKAGTFSYCNLPGIVIPTNITSIGDAAFTYCALGNITIPDSVTNLGSSAFAHSTLNTIIIGNGVMCIRNNTFERCLSLSGVSLGAGITSIDDSAFNDCENLASLTIPNAVTNIGNSAFSYCWNLTNVAFGSSLVSIGDIAFADCFYITNVVFPDALTSIGTLAFGGCYGLDRVMIPGQVSTIGIEAFAGCVHLSTIEVNLTNHYYSSLDGVLFNKDQTTLVEYPSGRSGAYVMPNTVTNVRDYAFYSCVSLNDIRLSDKLTSIGNFAFGGCSMGTITIPRGVIFIGDQAFSWTGIHTVYLLGNAPVIGSDLFVGNIYWAMNNATAYYLPGTTGWGDTFGYFPLVPWNPAAVIDDGNFGVQNNQFGFNITGSTNLVVVVEACVNLIHPEWQSVQTNTLADGSAYFSDSQWTNYPSRLYRFRSP